AVVLVVAVVGRGRVVVGFCWASERPDHRTIDVARESSNRRRDSGIDRLQSRKPFPSWHTGSCGRTARACAVPGFPLEERIEAHVARAAHGEAAAVGDQGDTVLALVLIDPDETRQIEQI